MKLLLKKLFSLFFLALVIFPIVERGVHSFEHQSDFHCISSDNHIHTIEHNCSICDFTLTNSIESPSKDFQFVLSSHQISFSTFYEGIHTPDCFTDLPARAPPLV